MAVGYAPQAREGCARPQRLVSALGQTLNFTVRGQVCATTMVSPFMSETWSLST